MTDLSDTITPKSDQLNADDLVCGAITIKITGVEKKKDPQQPTWLRYEGDNGKPYKPCLSMRRVLIEAWGDNGDAYIGRSMTLYRDKEVVYGGKKQGGIRISHLSHIGEEMNTLLTVRRGFREPYVVKPLVVSKKEITAEDKKAAAEKKAREIKAAIATAQDAAAVEQVLVTHTDAIDRLVAAYPELADDIENERQFKIDSLNQGA